MTASLILPYVNHKTSNAPAGPTQFTETSSPAKTAPKATAFLEIRSARWWSMSAKVMTISFVKTTQTDSPAGTNAHLATTLSPAKVMSNT